MPTREIRWRGRILSVSFEDASTMGELRQQLSALTDVPSERQTLLLAGRRSRPGDDELASAILPGPGGPPVAMLGTPRALAAAQVAASAEAVTDDEGDLADGMGIAGPPPPPPPPPVPAAWRRVDAGGFGGFPFPAPGTIEDVVSVEEVEQDGDGDGDGDEGHTNGATLRLEDVDEMLGEAMCGREFVEKFEGKRLSVMAEERFMAAVTRSKADLKMLAVLLLDMGENGEGEGDAAGDSAKLFNQTLQKPAVADLLNDEFVVYAADLSPLADSGASLLRRLGLHALPAVLLLSDVGSGVAIVDMFAAAFYDGPDAAGQIASRLRETQIVFEFGYEAARARRIASEDREGLIGEQDAEFLASAAADRAREEAAAEELRQAAEAERHAEEEVEKATNSLPPIPEAGGARLAVRLPDGRRVDRRFDEGQTKVKDLFNWCVSLGVKGGSFALSVSFPRRTLSLKEHGSCSLEAAGLMPTAALLVDIL